MATRITTINRVYVIIGLFIAIIVGLILLVQVQMNTLTAIRAFVGGEGLWAKAQKDAILSLEQYINSRNDADYQAYRRFIQVPLGDQQARTELLKPEPDLDVVRAGFLQGRNHPADVAYVVQFFRRFRHSQYLSKIIGHWSNGDRLIAELDSLAAAMHDEIASGRASPRAMGALRARLQAINARVSREEDLFSSTLADASRWANDVARKLTYGLAALFAALGIALSWPIVSRIRATESELFESEQKFRSITASALDAIAMIDDEGKTVFFNKAAEKMFGYAAAEVLGKDLHQLFAPARFMEDYRRAYPRFARSGEGAALGKVLELGALRKDGSEFPIELAVSAIHIKGRWNAVGIMRDISERKQTEDQIRRLNEELEQKVKERTAQLLAAQEELVRKEKLVLLGQVAGSVGHELRNPLGVMNNAVFFLQSVLPDADDNVREYLNIIKSEISASERIVSDLLDSVRTTPPQPEAVGVAELVGRTLRKFSVPASVAVELDIPAALPPLRVDAQQIQQVLRNLIGNGIEAMPGGGTLRIGAAADETGNNVTVSVRDTGIGMTAEQLDKAFQPLFTTKARGIGLGLVVVKNLTEANGGRVEVQSEAGRGSVFSVTLPAYVEKGKEHA